MEREEQRHAAELRFHLRTDVPGDADDRGRQYRAAIGAARAWAVAGGEGFGRRGGLFCVGAAVGACRAILGQSFRPARPARDDPAGHGWFLHQPVAVRHLPRAGDQRRHRRDQRVPALHRRAADLRLLRFRRATGGTGTGGREYHTRGTHPCADAARLRLWPGYDPRPGDRAVPAARADRRGRAGAVRPGVRVRAVRAGRVRDGAAAIARRSRAPRGGAWCGQRLSLDRRPAVGRQRARRGRPQGPRNPLPRPAHPHLDAGRAGHGPCAGDDRA